MVTVHWHDGFELYTSLMHLWRKYTAISISQGISTSIYRTGAQSLSTFYNSRGVRWNAALGTTTMTLGFALQSDNYKNINLSHPTITLIDNSAQIVLRFYVDVTGKVAVYRGGTLLGKTTNSVVSITSFNYIEIKVYAHQTAGTVEIRLNGESDTPELALSGIDTIETGILVEGFCLYGMIDTTNYWDDLYFATDFLGDSKVDVIRVTGAGNYSQFTPSAGNNEDNVDESPGPDDDTTYNDGDAVDEIDTYQMGDLSAGGTIHAFKIQGHYKKTDAGSAKLKQALRINGSDYLGAEKTLTTGYTCEYDIWNVNPDDAAAFETADINASELGAKVTELV